MPKPVRLPWQPIILYDIPPKTSPHGMPTPELLQLVKAPRLDNQDAGDQCRCHECQ